MKKFISKECWICKNLIYYSKDKYVYIKTRRKTEIFIHYDCYKKEVKKCQ